MPPARTEPRLEIICLTPPQQQVLADRGSVDIPTPGSGPLSSPFYYSALSRKIYGGLRVEATGCKQIFYNDSSLRKGGSLDDLQKKGFKPYILPNNNVSVRATETELHRFLQNCNLPRAFTIVQLTMAALMKLTYTCTRVSPDHYAAVFTLDVNRENLMVKTQEMMARTQTVIDAASVSPLRARQYRDFCDEWWQYSQYAFGGALIEYLQSRRLDGDLVFVNDTDLELPVNSMFFSRDQPLFSKYTVTYDDPAQGDGYCLPGKKIRFLMLVGDRGGLPFVETELARLQQTARVFSERVACSFFSPSAMDSEILKELEKADILHYLGHGSDDGWRFPDGVFSGDGHCRIMPAVVFSSACQSGRGGTRSPFFLNLKKNGVKYYLASSYRVPDGLSTGFFGHLYRQVIAGARIGDALSAVQQLRYAKNDIAWAVYGAGGDPRVKLLHAN